ncbi:MAG: SAM-dependent methyltransferase [Novosphingobium sp.]|nr:SAM-dependent methyltransferase [Novosphingobium sp.]
MPYALSLKGASPWPAVSITAALRPLKIADATCDDPRWPALSARLDELRERGRRALRIVHVPCGDGSLLIAAARRARSLGFLSIEALGADVDPEYIERARRQACLHMDSAIGFAFEVAPPLARLEAEAEFPADIVLYQATAGTPKALLEAARRAGDLVLHARFSA